jgi:hypothetical protein
MQRRRQPIAANALPLEHPSGGILERQRGRSAQEQ